MTFYEYYAIEENLCWEMAELVKDDEKLSQFYKSAAQGFAIKRDKLILETAAL